VTDGGFRPDGTFVPLPLHDIATLTEAFRRAVLRVFVRRGLLEAETAASMLAWPHSGFHVHDGDWVPAEDRAFATRLARYCSRHPVALSRLAFRADTGTVTYQSDKASGRTAGPETVDALEFLARVVSGSGVRAARRLAPGPARTGSRPRTRWRPPGRPPEPGAGPGAECQQRIDRRRRLPGRFVQPPVLWVLWEGRLKFLFRGTEP